MQSIVKWLTKSAEFIAAITLAAIFIVFILQIFFRYAPFLDPIGWSVVLISVLWVWLIFFGCAFLVRESDHVVFDVLYVSASKPMRKVMAILAALMVIAAMLYSFPATWESIMANRLMELKKIQTLRIPITGDRIPIKWLFAPYILLMSVIIIRYGWRIFGVLRYGPPETELEALSTYEAHKPNAKSPS